MVNRYVLRSNNQLHASFWKPLMASLMLFLSISERRSITRYCWLNHLVYNFSSTLNWIGSYISARSEGVRTQSIKSARNNSLGVLQGSVLGPLLFSPFIDDLPGPSNVTLKSAVQGLMDEMCITGLKNPNYTWKYKIVHMYFSKRATMAVIPKFLYKKTRWRWYKC